MNWIDFIFSGGGGGDISVESLSVTSNGTYTAPTGTAYSPVDVSVSGSATLIEKNISANGTYTASSDSADGYSKVVVSVANTYSAGDEGKVVKNGALASQGSATYTTNNTYDTTDISSVTVAVSGGGGASNVVTGTFTGTTTGAAMDVNLNYSGSGYPIAIMVYPTNGYVGNTAISSVIQQYAIVTYAVYKRNALTAPHYSGANDDKADAIYQYKSSSSSATVSSVTSKLDNYLSYSGGAATATNGQQLTFRSATKISVFIASTSYGFADNIEYTYYVIYSE